MKDYYTNDSGWKVGDRALVFDFLAWQANGGDAKNNDVYMMPATIVNIGLEEESKINNGRLRTVAAVQFDHRERVSKGHFLYAMERVNGERIKKTSRPKEVREEISQSKA